MNRPRRYWTPELLADLLVWFRSEGMPGCVHRTGLASTTLYPLIRRAKALQAGRGPEPKLRAQYK